MEATMSEIQEWKSFVENEKDNCIPVFFWKAVQDKRKTEIEGRPVFNQVAYIKIIIPGDRLSQPVCKVADEHKQRWPKQWEKFQLKSENVLEGTPIEDWPYLNVAQIATMKALNIMTVEALADLGDSGLEKIGMGAREIQRRARQFLKGPSDTEKDLREELSTLKARVKVLETENAGLRRENIPETPAGKPVDDAFNDLSASS